MNLKGVKQTLDFAIKLKCTIVIGDHHFYFDKYLPQGTIDQQKKIKNKRNFKIITSNQIRCLTYNKL